MVRAALLIGAAGFLLISCRLPPERDALRAIPEGQIYTYSELLRRARVEATTAVEAFYVDGWRDLEEAAGSLSQTARFLPKSIQIPGSVKARLPEESAALHKDAVALGDAARARDLDKTNELLQRINLRVRQLRPREAAAFDEPRPEPSRPQSAPPEPAPLPTTPKLESPEAKDVLPPPVFPKVPGD